MSESLSDSCMVDPSRLRPGEADLIAQVARGFEAMPVSTTQKLEAWPLWVRQREIAKFLVKAQMMQALLTVPGVIVECGVLYGAGVATWLQLSDLYEPVNFSRRVVGCDTFSGFPAVGVEDRVDGQEVWRQGHFAIGTAAPCVQEALRLVDAQRKIPQIPRLTLLEGDVCETVPQWIEADESLQIALLYLDLDLYEPTRRVLEVCLPRMAAGSVIAFDEWNCPDWPGETQAGREMLAHRRVTWSRSPLVPHLAWCTLG